MEITPTPPWLADTGLWVSIGGDLLDGPHDTLTSAIRRIPVVMGSDGITDVRPLDVDIMSVADPDATGPVCLDIAHTVVVV